MRLVKREAGSPGVEAEETQGLALLPVVEEPFRVPSAIQQLLGSCAGLATDEKVALVRARAQEAEVPVWPRSPPDGVCEKFAPVLASPGARKRLKRATGSGRMSAQKKVGDHASLDGTWPNGGEEVDEDDEDADEVSLGTWMPAGEGCCRSSDARVFFAVTQASVPSAYCRLAFPCPRTFAPCAPLGHATRGKLELSQKTGRSSFVLVLEILNGGCRPLYVVTVFAASGERVLHHRHSQPSVLLQMVMVELLDEAVPRITDDVAATFFGLDLPHVQVELTKAWERRQRQLAQKQ
jgi:hypothetical protein